MLMQSFKRTYVVGACFGCVPRHLQLAGACGRLQDQGVVTHHPVVLHAPQAKMGACSRKSLKKAENKIHVLHETPCCHDFGVVGSLDEDNDGIIYLCLPALPACLPLCHEFFLLACTHVYICIFFICTVYT